jgi:hypothetical protein
MIAAGQINSAPRRIRLRPIALPVEHGGWSVLFEPFVVVIVHVLVVFIIIALARAALVPFLAVAALVILLLRATIGFSNSDKRVTAKKLGVRELSFGAMTVFAVVLGHALGW